MDDLITTKIITMVLLGIISVIIGIIPLKLSRLIGNRENKKTETLVTSMLLCFGGGVLLATSMVHILPEVREGLEGYGEGISVSLPELVVCLGFFLVYFVEELVHLLLHKKNNQQLERSFSIRKKSCGSHDESVKDLESMNSSTEEGHGHEGHSHKGHSHKGHSHEGHSHEGHSHEGHSHQEQKGHTHQGHSHIVIESNNALRDLLTVIALSFHAVFEGMAVGLEEDENDVWTLFAAIGCHKFVITFCVFLELSQTGTRLVFYSLYLVSFAVMSPIGIGVGIIITHVSAGGEYHQIYIAILQGIAAGTIIYIVMFEVLQREKSRNISGLLQLFAIMAGFSVMIIIQIFAGHHHDHGDHIHDNCTETHFRNYHLYNVTTVSLEDTAKVISTKML